MTPFHPFAKFIRTVGRGAQLARPLERDEAEAAMTLILTGEVEPAQLGAFLMLLRYRGETAEELAGFVTAARRQLDLPAAFPSVDLDWPSYADRHKQLPYFVLSAAVLAQNGVRIVMHGIKGATEGFAPTAAALAQLGVGPCETASAAAAALDRHNFAYLPLERLSPRLERLFALRPLLGLRSPVNTLARALNPFAAPCQLQGVFHPNYRPLHQHVAALLGQPVAAIFKGGGGEIQRNPDKPCLVLTLEHTATAEEEWPALTPSTAYPWRDETAQIERIGQLWRGEIEAPAPTAAVVGTVALALRYLGRAAGPVQAMDQAAAMWRGREVGATLTDSTTSGRHQTATALV
ncbi:MAG: glycosyl transferase family protein [Azospirillum sp.]|nr:glycosyl transferase family protein [Azospirillum sp.]